MKTILQAVWNQLWTGSHGLVPWPLISPSLTINSSTPFLWLCDHFSGWGRVYLAVQIHWGNCAVLYQSLWYPTRRNSRCRLPDVYVAYPNGRICVSSRLVSVLILIRHAADGPLDVSVKGFSGYITSYSTGSDLNEFADAVVPADWASAWELS